MSFYLIISFVFIGIFIAFSLGQLFLYWFDNKEKLYLLIASLGVISSTYLFLSVILHTTTELSDVSSLLKWQVNMYFIGMGLLCSIINDINRRHYNKLFHGVLIFVGLLTITNTFLPNGLIFREITGLVVNIVFGTDNYNAIEGEVYSFYWALVLLSYSVFIGYFTINAIYAKRTNHMLRNKVLVWVMLLYLVSNIYDVLLDTGLVQGIFLTEYMILPIIILLSLNVFLEIKKGRLYKEKYDEVVSNFTLLIEHVQLYVVALNEKGQVIYMNPYFCKRMGFEKEVRDKHRLNEIFMANKEAEDFNDIYRDIWEKGEVSQIGFQLVSQKNDLFNVDWSIVPVKNKQGKVIELLAVGTDITQRVRSNDQLKIAVTELSDAKEQLENENTFLRKNLNSELVQNHMIGNSVSMKYVYHSIEEVSQGDTSVLIEGETGVGKELVARAIHDKSKRSSKPYVKLNCAALPKGLIESELFGHEKGAFTGAVSARKGRFELADGGTIFLDEIGELPLDLQSKMLRVLENYEFSRLGSESLKKVDVRVIAATNKNLRQCTQEGSFRLDLYYRLSVFPITVPPLRKRVDDIPLLVDHFLNMYCKKLQINDLAVSIATMKKLESYSWPGNVRELKNVIERGVVSSTNRKKLYIDPSSLSEYGGSMLAERKSLSQIEKEYIIAVLNDTNWKVSGEHSASAVLDLNEGTLRSKMKKLGIQRD